LNVRDAAINTQRDALFKIIIQYSSGRENVIAASMPQHEVVVQTMARMDIAESAPRMALQMRASNLALGGPPGAPAPRAPPPHQVYDDVQMDLGNDEDDGEDYNTAMKVAEQVGVGMRSSTYSHQRHGLTSIVNRPLLKLTRIGPSVRHMFLLKRVTNELLEWVWLSPRL